MSDLSALKYIQRTLEGVLSRAVREFPAVVLTGPRQAGKTTLLRHLLARSHAYVSLDPPDVSAAAEADPRGFLRRFPAPVVLDEIQQAPGLLPYLKELIDGDRAQAGRFVLCGSQNLLLLSTVSETLAGRAAILRLLPLSRREALGLPDEPFAWETGARATPAPADDPWPALVRGGYPELVAQPSRDAALWHSSYLQTYLERDVRGLRQVGDLSQFQLFLRALAARSGQLLNLSALARDLGIAVNTAKAWLGVLEASHQIFLLRPFHANLGKRLVKTPKVYFADLGTLCHLVGLRDPVHAAAGPMGGALFETAVVTEVVRTLTHRGLEPQLHFWRTSTGSEVDLLVGREGRWVPLEVKLSATPRPEMARGIEELGRALGDTIAPGYVVHPGESTLPLGPRAQALPWSSL